MSRGDRVQATLAAGDELLTWVREHAPVTAGCLQEPRPSLEVQHVLAGIDATIPAELTAWLSLTDGVGLDLRGMLLPGHLPLGIEDIVDEWRVNVRAGREGVSSQAYKLDCRAQAGESSLFYLSSWVPFAADGGGGGLIIDTRRGRESGVIDAFDAEGGASFYDQTWPDLPTLLSQTAAAVESMTAVNGWQPRVDDGELAWDVVQYEDV